MHFCNIKLIGLVWCGNIFALHREKVEIQLITRYHLYITEYWIIIGMCESFKIWEILSSKHQITLPFYSFAHVYLLEQNHITLAFLLFHFPCDTEDTCDNPSWREHRGEDGGWGGGESLIVHLVQLIDTYLGRRRTETNRITPASSGSFLKSRKG